ncbi:MAG: hypothetical protein O8C61_03260 [Candidatus Methanoperedens sp.]|nr:hypothetical protein [Candidatus Methanoperedens sp.]
MNTKRCEICGLDVDTRGYGNHLVSCRERSGSEREAKSSEIIASGINAAASDLSEPVINSGELEANLKQNQVKSSEIIASDINATASDLSESKDDDDGVSWLVETLAIVLLGFVLIAGLIYLAYKWASQKVGNTKTSAGLTSPTPPVASLLGHT